MNKWFVKFLVFVNVILYLTTIFLWIALTQYLTLNISLSVFAICLTLALILKNKEDLDKFVSSSQFKNFINNGVQMGLIVAILALVNYLSFKNPKQMDLTENKLNTLSGKSRQILDSVKGPVKVTAFVNNKDAGKIIPLLDLYRLEKNDFIIDRIDPQLRPDLSKSYGIEKYGQMALQFEDRKLIIKEYSESAITNALMKISSNEKKTIYFARGHRMGSLGDTGKEGLSRLKKSIEDQTYKIQEVDLRSETPEVNAHSALIVWGPKDGFLEHEMKVLKEYADKGGNILISLDPDLDGDKHQNLRSLIADRGIKINNDLVVDSISHISGTGGAIPVVKKFDDKHEITKSLKGDTFFPLVSSVSAKVVKGIKTTLLNFTTPFPASWAETNLEQIKSTQVVYDQNIDRKGPISMMASSEIIEGALKGAKTIVIGNSSFVQNQYSNYQNNFNLLINSINWLLDNAQLISFDAPKTKNDRIVINVSQMQVIFYFAVILLPILLFLVSLLFYKRRAVS